MEKVVKQFDRIRNIDKFSKYVPKNSNELVYCYEKTVIPKNGKLPFEVVTVLSKAPDFYYYSEYDFEDRYLTGDEKKNFHNILLFKCRNSWDEEILYPEQEASFLWLKDWDYKSIIPNYQDFENSFLKYESENLIEFMSKCYENTKIKKEIKIKKQEIKDDLISLITSRTPEENEKELQSFGEIDWDWNYPFYYEFNDDNYRKWLFKAIKFELGFSGSYFKKYKKHFIYIKTNSLNFFDSSIDFYRLNGDGNCRIDVDEKYINLEKKDGRYNLKFKNFFKEKESKLFKIIENQFSYCYDEDNYYINTNDFTIVISLKEIGINNYSFTIDEKQKIIVETINEKIYKSKIEHSGGACIDEDRRSGVGDWSADFIEGVHRQIGSSVSGVIPLILDLYIFKNC